MTTFDPAYKSPWVTLSGGDLTAAQNLNNGVEGVRGTVGKTTGKWYWEATHTGATASDIDVGFANTGYPSGANGGRPGQSDTNGVAYTSGGTLFYNNIGFGAPVLATWSASGAVVMLAVDVDANLFWVGVNGTWDGNPAAGTGGRTIGGSGSIYPWAGFFNETSGSTVTANFGATAFAYTEPSGFSGWDTAAAPANAPASWFDGELGINTWFDPLLDVAKWFDATLPATASSPPSNDIIGSAALAFTTSAATSGAGAIAASSSIGFTPSAALTGRADVAASSSLAFVPVAAASGIGAITGTSPLAITPSGALLGIGSVTASSAIAFTPAAALNGRGEVAASSGVSFTPTAALLGKGEVTTTAALAFTVSATVAANDNLVGAAALGFSPSGGIAGRGGIDGAGSVSFALSGLLAGNGAVSGLSAVSFTPSGALSGIGSVTSAASFGFGVAGEIYAPPSNDLAGQVSFGISCSGTLHNYHVTFRAVRSALVIPMNRNTASAQIRRGSSSPRSSRAAVSRRR